MLIIEKNNIGLTRGDILNLDLVIKNPDESDYVFQSEDIIRFTLTEKKNENTVLLKKDFKAKQGDTTLRMDFTKEDTTIKELINKPQELWLEVCLNPDTEPQTVIGYSLDGPTIFTLLPEAGNKGGAE